MQSWNSLRIFPTVILSIVTLSSNVVFASSTQCLQNMRHDVAWSIGTDTKFEVLTRRQSFKQNRHITDEAEVKSRVQAYLEAIPERKESNAKITNDKLSGLIAKAHMVTGVSYAALTGIMHQESLACIFRWNKKGGDSGCMQFTSIAVHELKDQFGVGEMKTSERVNVALAGWADEYFGVNTERRAAFRSWINKDTEAMRVELRSPGNEDIDIFAGAVLLKIYLAVNEGDYEKAIADYNGGGDKRYSEKVLPKAYKVNYTCESASGSPEDMAYAQRIFENVCVGQAISEGKGEEAVNECLYRLNSEEAKSKLIDNTQWI